jgi:preprotein translocase subunit SecY
MTKLLNNNKFFSKRKQTPNQKLLVTISILCLYRFCNTIPLSGIDNLALKESFLQFEKNNSIVQILNMYSGGGGKTVLSPFSLGIIPFINASILIDLLTTLLPFLEKLQSEEGETGRQTVLLYKKILTLLFAIIQSLGLLFSLRSFIYSTTWITYFFLTAQLTAGAFSFIWLTNLIDKKGLGNGTSLIILVNILFSFFNRGSKLPIKFSSSLLFETSYLFILIAIICISQTARFTIPIVSARQLVYLENLENSHLDNLQKRFQKSENGLSIRLNQAGIFPIIIASNLLPFFSFFFQSFGNKILATTFTTVCYYFFIVVFNYLYTIVFWDPEKIAEKLRKASVSIKDVSPGSETVSYLENTVRASSFYGGLFLCCILGSYEFVKPFTSGILLNQINISSLLIVTGVIYDTLTTFNSLNQIHRSER